MYATKQLCRQLMQTKFIPNKNYEKYNVMRKKCKEKKILTDSTQRMSHFTSLRFLLMLVGKENLDG